MITECEVKIGGEWKVVDFETAVTHHLKELKRCPHCWGRVSQYRLKGVVPHFGHYEAHDGCPKTQHPNPLT